MVSSKLNFLIVSKNIFKGEKLFSEFYKRAANLFAFYVELVFRDSHEMQFLKTLKFT